MDRFAPTRADELHCLRLPAASLPRRAPPDEAGENADLDAGPATLAEPARRATRHPRPAVEPPRHADPMSALPTQVSVTSS